jgi:hypothetical protein
MAPMPSAISDHDPRVLFSACSPVAAPSAMRRSIDFVRDNELATRRFPFVAAIISVYAPV